MASLSFISTRWSRRSLGWGPIWSMAAFAALLLGVIVVGGAQSLREDQSRMRRDAAIEVSNLAVAFEQNVTRTVRELDRILMFLRRSYERADGNVTWQSLLREEFTIDDQTAQVAVIDADGRMISSSAMLFPAQPVDLSDREHFKYHRAATSDELFISKPVIGRASGKASVQFARRLTHADGQFAGVIVVSLDPARVAKAYEQIDMGQGGLALVGIDGIVRAGTGRFKTMLGRGFREGTAVRDIGLQLVGTQLTEQQHEGRTQLVALRRVPGMPLEVIAVADGITQSEAWTRQEYAFKSRNTMLAFLLLGVVIVNVLVHRRHQMNLVRVAHHDALTSLPNRVEFVERLGEAVAAARPGAQVALHLLDLDRFKAVNDTHGHPMGDALLKQVGVRLAAGLRDRDFVARLGGDEFAIIQCGVADHKEAEVVSSRICKLISQPFELNGVVLNIGTSVGTAFTPGDGKTPEELIASADLALYSVKANGRGGARQFEVSMSEAVRQRRLIERDLEGALDRNELELHYQSILSFKDKHIIGYEALIRWRHPDRGLIPPGLFIPIAEETGLINRIGAWALERACRDAAAWPDDVKVAVNCSPEQFKTGDLAEIVADALHVSGLKASRLDIEITESTLMDRESGASAQVTALKELGVEISMDDFGTGYSSLSYLESYRTDYLKIDRSFVQKIGKNATAKPIIKAIITLAHALGMSTVAEGVETQAQYDELAELGCEYVQGFLLSRPVPLAELPHSKAAVRTAEAA